VLNRHSWSQRSRERYIVRLEVSRPADYAVGQVIAAGPRVLITETEHGSAMGVRAALMRWVSHRLMIW